MIQKWVGTAVLKAVRKRWTLSGRIQNANMEKIPRMKKNNKRDKPNRERTE